MKDSLNDEELVGAVAAREGWHEFERHRFTTLRNRVNTVEGVDETFLIARAGDEPPLDRVVAVASWPLWESVRLAEGPTPILNAVGALALKLAER